ncbi:MAG: 50S ribosomal protein L19 [Clostridiales bacterium]|nr:50S ribosomal protein L19 [Clostridiales bacterium]
MDLIKTLTKEQLKPEVPVLNIGDTVRVHNRIKEGNRERVQIFEGTIIAKRGGGISQTFTVRRISYGVGVEKTFPVHSPNVEKVEIIRSGKVRRAKLYYLRGRVGKRSKVKEQLFVASSANSNAGTNSVEENTVETSSEE